MDQDGWFEYSPGVSVSAEDALITFRSPELRMRVRVPDPELRSRLLEMTEKPVSASEIPQDVALSLSGHGLVTRGAHAAHLQALRMHAESSVPINRGLAYTPEQLTQYQVRGRAKRFLAGGVSDGLDLPLPLRRTPSFDPFDGPRAKAVAPGGSGPSCRPCTIRIVGSTRPPAPSTPYTWSPSKVVQPVPEAS